MTTPGTYEIFRVVFRRPDNRDIDRNPPPDGDTSNRYMVKMTGNPESYHLRFGPWVDGPMRPTNATSDAFGRIYYLPRRAYDGKFFRSNGWEGTVFSNSTGLLANKLAFVDINPFDSGWGILANTMPVDRTFPLRLTSGFGPGEVKVFTLGQTTEWRQTNPSDWTQTNRMHLVNDYDPDLPVFFWTNFVELPAGPSSSEANGLRWTTTIRLNSPPYEQGARA